MKHWILAPDGQATLGQLVARAWESGLASAPDPGEVARLLVQGSVQWNKQRVRQADWIPPQAAGGLEVFYPELPIHEFILDPERIVYEDAELLLVDKPAGVNAAPSPFSDRDCLTWGVQTYLGPEFPIHAVHRLDRETQGLMFFAKTKAAERGLHQLFRRRQVLKIYQAWTPLLASASGEPERRVYRLRDQLAFRGRVQTACTTLIWRERSGDRLGWTVIPHTGRPHQIRQHFVRYLAPLWGDSTYAPQLYPRGSRLALACVEYRFRHPITGQRLEIRRPPVDEN